VRFRLERLTSAHPVDAFTCGDRPGASEIDAYLRSHALHEQTTGLSTTTVAVDGSARGEADVLVGFYTLSPLSVPVRASVLAACGLIDVPYRSVGGYLLGRLGVSVRSQGEGLGPLLVERAITAARLARESTGGAFLALDAKNEALVCWYLGLGFGFVRLDPEQSRLVLRL
jgi:GNAT superfamily N-acetyltransferase